VQTFAFAGLLALLGASTATAQTYVENGIQGAGKHHVIITIIPGHENDVIDTLKKHGNQVRSQHPSINGVAADINGTDVADLANHGAVTITQDHPVHLSAAGKKSTTTASPLGPGAQPKNVSTLRASLGLSDGAVANTTSGINGTGVRVAIIDSGIESSSDFANLIGFKDYTGKTACQKVACAYDDLGHGTHIAGLIASSGVLTNYMFQGVAPNAQVLALKVLDAKGASKTSTVIAAIEDVVANKSADIINLSLGHPITAPAKFDPLVQAIESAVRNGIVVVVAAGNDGPAYGSINSPGNAPSAITVGAVDGLATVTRVDDYVASFSGRGPTWYDGFAKPDVVAPGVNLFSDAVLSSTLYASTPVAWKEHVDKTDLIALSGTSMAAAVATGVVALELDANAHQARAPLTPNAAKAILEYTAVKLPNTNVLVQGVGQLNAAGASQLAGSINTAAQTGAWWLTGGVNASSGIGGSTYAWSQNIIWGTSLFSGRFIYYNAAAWDDSIIWGTGVVQGGTLLSGSKHIKVRGQFADSIIWGTDFQVVRRNVVFGNDSDNIIWGTAKNLAQFRIVGQRLGSKIVWNTEAGDNIIWGTLNDDSIVWGTNDGDSIIWGTWSGDGDNIIWGTTSDDSIIWGTSEARDNIIWGTSATLAQLVKTKKAVGSLNIVWATGDVDSIIWGTMDLDNIIWGTQDDNIIWGTESLDNIIWGTESLDNIIWGTENVLDNIIWGTSVGGRN
jgi:serine protease AprX